MQADHALRKSMTESLTFCGRTFGLSELDLMRQVAREFSALGVTEIARTVCELLEWTRPNGGLKNHECRQLLERLQAAGLLELPELRKRGGKGPRRPDISGPSSEPAPVACGVGECERLELVLRQPARDREQRKISHPPMGSCQRTREQNSGLGCSANAA